MIREKEETYLNQFAKPFIIIYVGQVGGSSMQLELISQDEHSLRDQLESHFNAPVDLTVTNNVSSMVSFKPANRTSPIQLRLHRMFLWAPPHVVNAMGTWLTRNRCKRSAAVIDQFISTHRHLVDSKPTKPIKTRTRGLHFDLMELFAEVNEQEFDRQVDAPITWGKRPPRGKRQYSIRFGSYTPEDHIIRIHPYLDQDWVPRYFVRYVVFHEMLHAHMGIEEKPSGRRSVHPPEFKRLEKAYPDYEKAIGWHDHSGNLNRLLRPQK
jgi:hypothetical protein